ncbi:arginase family protein [Aspergillus fijiensis CBS 313.89]|uniref:Arginase n=1 Tax=Aspergillus fijiensis CBS 313.89 TaxID=1448319 RepID=A0A8G1VXI3_9EURO|nr:arginase [Aspergillus fijiensis CBS 313.89]RAK72994.1 arginase [Aspergillus fijiensis CBS 313.89]
MTASLCPQAIDIILSPYHVGLRDHRVGNGPHRILSLGLEQELHRLGVAFHLIEIPPVNEFEGEIGRSFELLRRISTAVSQSVANRRFPLILSGNCMASAAVACGLRVDDDLAYIYFDAHDDLDSPDVNENGYLDAMGLSMLRGESWKTLMNSVPGFKPAEFNRRFLYCGLRDQTGVQRQRVIDAGMQAIWGSTENKVDFARELKTQLEQRAYGQVLVHLDLDVLDDSYGKVNDYPSPGGLLESDLIACMELVPQKTTPRSLTVCSFDPDAGDGDKIAGIAVRAIIVLVQSLLDTGALSKI